MSDLLHEVLEIDTDIRLIQLHEADAYRLFELTDKNRSYLGKFLPWVSHVKTVDDSCNHILETMENRTKGITYTYGIEYQGDIVGDISLRNITDNTKTEIGYWISEEFAGRGITTRAVKSMTNFGLQTLKLSQIFIRADPNNLPSNKVAENAGYTFIGNVKDDKYDTLNVWRVEQSAPS